ncbi:MAG: amidohydrolase family protein [Lentisphaerae bacterium]|jgi:N-acetylglucosamine-6-phosphate deacetylase|nr:amidohydrolase family protein [Lentisphaerota bacterium]
MKIDLLIDNACVVGESVLLPDSAVEIGGGRILRIRPAGDNSSVPADAVRVDAGGRYLAPGFIDLHIHGMHKHLVDRSPADLAAVAGILPQFGVTGFLPTVCPLPPGRDAEALQAIAEAAPDAPGARVLGFHLEGPFLTLTGAISKDSLGPADPARVDALMAAAAPCPAIFSVAPDMPGIEPLIRRMSRNGTPVFMTHTAANVVETQRAIAAGACHATHFYDVFPVPPVTEGGVRPCGAVEAILADPRVSVDFILDGVHVDPVAVQMALQCKGPDRVSLITDAMVGAGLPPGRHVFGGQDVIFPEPGAPARLVGTPTRKGGGLVGSGLTLNLAVRNAVRMIGVSLPQAVRMASANPAQVLGLAGSKGRILPGYDADLVIFDESYDVQQTWVGGNTVFKKEI